MPFHALHTARCRYSFPQQTSASPSASPPSPELSQEHEGSVPCTGKPSGGAERPGKLAQHQYPWWDILGSVLISGTHHCRHVMEHVDQVPSSLLLGITEVCRSTGSRPPDTAASKQSDTTLPSLWVLCQYNQEFSSLELPSA